MEIVHTRVTELKNATGYIIFFVPPTLALSTIYKPMDLWRKEDEYKRTINKHTKQKEPMIQNYMPIKKKCVQTSIVEEYDEIYKEVSTINFNWKRIM